MTMRTHAIMSPGHSARVTESMDLSYLAFCKRYRSSYETPSPSPTLPVRMRYRGMSEPILDTNNEEDEIGEEDTDKDRLDGKGYGLDEKGHGLDDEGYGLDNEGHGLDDEGHGLDDEGRGLDEEQAVMIAKADVSEPLGLRYEALRQQELAADEASPVATPTATIPVDKDQFIEIGAQLELYEGILQNHTQRLYAMPPTLFAELDRDVRELYTRALQRPVLVLEAWARHIDTHMADMS
nr:hypothetical protein [Tanacetum cinerariifolium]